MPDWNSRVHITNHSNQLQVIENQKNKLFVITVKSKLDEQHVQ